MKIYFSGIGGAAISSLAILYKMKGCDVSGSDVEDSLMLQKVKESGIDVKIPQISSNITSDIDLLIRSAAITDNNPEIIEAKKLGIRIERREYLLDKLMKDFYSLSVCGTHGKTTTTALLSHCLIELNENPSYLIGGILESTGKSMEFNKSKYITWEADEYSNAFLGVHVNATILNNVEYDHPDFFKNEQEYLSSFKKFVRNNVSDIVIYNSDSLLGVEAINMIKNKRIISFGKKIDNVENDYNISNINFGKDNTQFIISSKEDNYFIFTKLLGEHNVYNCCAVFCLLSELGFDKSKVIAALNTFKGTLRRQELLFEDDNKVIISDYAHHPTAIRETIKAIKAYNLPITVVFEPHQFGRLQNLLNDFQNAFNNAEEVFILPVFEPVGREESHEKDFLLDFFSEIKNDNKTLYNSYSEVINYIKTFKSDKRVFLCMSAAGLDKELRKAFGTSMPK